MSDQRPPPPAPRPLLEDPNTDPQAREVLTKGSEIQEWSAHERELAWRKLRYAASDTAPSMRRWRLGAAAGALAGVAVAVGLMANSLGHRLVLPEVGTLTVSRGAELSVVPPLPDGLQTVQIFKGRVAFSIDRHPAGRSLVVVAPGLRIVDLGTVFSVEVEGKVSTVEVEQGSVRVEAPDSNRTIGAGERLRFDESSQDLLPGAARFPEGSRPVSGCGDAGAADIRRRCYLAASQGGGLSGQNALYALALLDLQSGAGRTEVDEGIQTLQSYLARFPEGVFGPEVSAHLTEALVRASRFAEALAEADRFAARYPLDPNGDRVGLIKANVLLSGVHRAEEARAAYLQLTSSPEGSIRQEAAFQLARCEAELGDRQSASRHFKEYLEAYPSGARRAEAQRWLQGAP